MRLHETTNKYYIANQLVTKCTYFSKQYKIYIFNFHIMYYILLLYLSPFYIICSQSFIILSHCFAYFVPQHLLFKSPFSLFCSLSIFYFVTILLFLFSYIYYYCHCFATFVLIYLLLLSHYFTLLFCSILIIVYTKLIIVRKAIYSHTAKYWNLQMNVW